MSGSRTWEQKEALGSQVNPGGVEGEVPIVILAPDLFLGPIHYIFKLAICKRKECR